MLVPLIVLAALAAVAGLVGTPWWNGYGAFVRTASGEEHGGRGPNYALMAATQFFAFAGMVLGWRLYRGGQFALAAWKNSSLAMAFYRLSRNKLYFDELYWALFVTPLFHVTRAAAWLDRTVLDGLVNGAGWGTVQFSKLQRLIDVYVIDGIVNLCGWMTKKAGQVMRPIQSGQVQNYLLAIFLGAIVVVWWFFSGI